PGRSPRRGRRGGSAAGRGFQGAGPVHAAVGGLLMATRVSKGAPVHGEFSSADASALTEAASRFALYGAASTAAVTLAGTDVVVITDLLINTGAAITVQVYDGADNAVGAGELVHKATVNGTTTFGFATPHYCRAGTYPKVKTSGAGQVDCLLRGSITTIGP